MIKQFKRAYLDNSFDKMSSHCLKLYWERFLSEQQKKELLGQ